MKVVHISYSVSNSSANTRLHDALIRRNVDSKILVLSHSGDVSETYNLKKSILRRVYNVFETKFFQLRYGKINVKYGFPFSVGSKGYSLYRNKLLKNADIIHLHWICGILSIKDIKKLQKTGKPIVWTCHDSWPFTGGCHVRYGCTGFMNECGKCDMIQSNKSIDWSHKILKRKMKLLRDSKIVFIAPSKWMMESIKDSAVFSGNQVINIPNAIDTHKFMPLNEHEVEKVMGVNKWKGNINILFGAGDTRTPYKGYEFLIKVLKMLHDKNVFYVKQVVLHIVGASEKDHELESMYRCVYWGYVDETEKMAAIYNIADVMLYPSLDDNLPNMVMESMACATPVIAFRTGGIPDMINHKENGFLASYRNEKEMVEGIDWVLNNNQENKLGKSAREKVVQYYSEERIAQLHIDLYKSLIKE